MAAHWLQKSDQGTYDYDIRMVQSSNRGATWGESIVVHNDGVAAEHGFVSMLPMDNKDIFITWLDGRNTKGSDHESGEHGGEGAMTLRGAIFDAQGNAKARWELDNRICDCCQTSAAMTSNGPVVVYRDRSETEIRDMSIVRYVNGKWTPPQGRGCRTLGNPRFARLMALPYQPLEIMWQPPGLLPREEHPKLKWLSQMMAVPILASHHDQ